MHDVGLMLEEQGIALPQGGDGFRRASLRILDLGCSDGWMSLWLARRMRERGVHVTVSGLELNPAAADVARDRLAAEGFLGEIAPGRAEDAPLKFQPGSFDAVLACEIIEHVPDPQQLLDACERMLRPGGRVYLSTPDGTFGDGGNPHHLRTYDIEELLLELRRRGRLVDGLAGNDGVAAAAYEPGERLGELAIYVGAGWETWAPWDPEKRGLGGSETAAIRLAHALSEIGWCVSVYGDVHRGMVGEVLYEHHSAFDPSEPRAALISSRQPAALTATADRRILWMHDVDCGDQLTPALAARADRIAVLSRWHHAHVLSRYPFLTSDQLLRTANGIDPYRFPELSDDERPTVAFASSSPDRGLDFLLELWPRVRECLPGAELRHCYADVYNRVADGNPVVAAHRARLAELSEQPGVVNLGSLTQPALADAMRDARAWLHPSWSTPHGQPFFETYCIGALEAAAAGCVRVCSNWGALPERKPEVLLGKRRAPALDADAWVDAIVAALTVTQARAGAQAAALQCTWAKVAQDFTSVLAPTPVR